MSGAARYSRYVKQRELQQVINRVSKMAEIHGVESLMIERFFKINPLDKQTITSVEEKLSNFELSNNEYRTVCKEYYEKMRDVVRKAKDLLPVPLSQKELN